MRLKYFFTNESTSPVDVQIDAVLDEMLRIGPDNEEYPKMLENLERLYKIKEGDRRDPVSKDTIALVLGNLLGIMVIVAYEQRHVITSQGFKQLIRPKLPGGGNI